MKSAVLQSIKENSFLNERKTRQGAIFEDIPFIKATINTKTKKSLIFLSPVGVLQKEVGTRLFCVFFGSFFRTPAVSSASFFKKKNVEQSVVISYENTGYKSKRCHKQRYWISFIETRVPSKLQNEVSSTAEMTCPKAFKRCVGREITGKKKPCSIRSLCSKLALSKNRRNAMFKTVNAMLQNRQSHISSWHRIRLSCRFSIFEKIISLFDVLAGCVHQIFALLWSYMMLH